MLHIRIVGKWHNKESVDQQQVEQVFGFAFDRFRHAIREAVILFSDLNGPKGGIDTQCVVRTKLTNGKLIIGKAKGPDIAGSAYMACYRASRALSRQLSRQVNAVRKMAQGPWVRQRLT